MTVTLGFKVTLRTVEFEPLNEKDERTNHDYLVVFEVTQPRHEPARKFEIPVWVRGRQVAPEDVVKVAQQQLQADLKLLADWQP